MTPATQPAKYKTTLYLTAENKQRLKHIPKGKMTALINQAIAEKLIQFEREQAKQMLLASLTQGKWTPTNGISTSEATQNIRQQASDDAVIN